MSSIVHRLSTARGTAGGQGTIRIGISGWTYTPWRGVFYPTGLPHKRELAFAAAHFPTVEINGTFYRLQRPEDFVRWRCETPDGFEFSVKGSRYITHMLKLGGIEKALANFFACGLLRLGPKLGPILWQFSPQMRFDEPRFAAFLEALPRDTHAAAALARKHDARVTGRASLKAIGERRIRHAVEIRHDSFCMSTFVDLLRAHDTALVCADTVSWPLVMDLTSDFVYCRLHGSKKLYVSGYDAKALDRWAARIGSWARGGEPADARRIASATKPRARGRDVYVYFDNDAKVRAPRDAASLIELLGLANGNLRDRAAIVQGRERSRAEIRTLGA